MSQHSKAHVSFFAKTAAMQLRRAHKECSDVPA
jgi:hypothetical protein